MEYIGFYENKLNNYLKILRISRDLDLQYVAFNSQLLGPKLSKVEHSHESIHIDKAHKIASAILNREVIVNNKRNQFKLINQLNRIIDRINKFQFERAEELFFEIDDYEIEESVLYVDYYIIRATLDIEWARNTHWHIKKLINIVDYVEENTKINTQLALKKASENDRPSSIDKYQKHIKQIFDSHGVSYYYTARENFLEGFYSQAFRNLNISKTIAVSEFNVTLILKNTLIEALCYYFSGEDEEAKKMFDNLFDSIEHFSSDEVIVEVAEYYLQYLILEKKYKVAREFIIRYLHNLAPKYTNIYILIQLVSIATQRQILSKKLLRRLSILTPRLKPLFSTNIKEFDKNVEKCIEYYIQYYQREKNLFSTVVFKELRSLYYAATY